MKLSVVILPSQRWSEARPMWERSESLGLHAAYTYDHLSWRSFRDKTWFTMVPTLVAAATVTTTIRLGPLVTSANFRHPLVLAKDMLALDDVSNGRAIVGIGSGGTGFDATVLGHEAWPTGERHRRFVEFTRAVDRLLRETSSTFEGTYYPVVESRQFPGPVQRPRPPIYLSALGPRTLALTAELADGWACFGDPSLSGADTTYESVRRLVAALDQELATRQRDPRSLTRVLLDFEGDERPMDSYDAFIDWAGRYRDLGFDELVVHWPIAASPYDTDRAVFERIATEGRESIANWNA